MAVSRRTLLATGAAAGVAPLAGPPHTVAASGRPDGAARVRTGFERLAADGYRLLDGQRVGVITNQSGITSDARGVVDVMHADRRVRLRAVFGAEHGYRGTPQAGLSEGDYTDPASGLPVYDTYRKSGQPLADLFDRAGVDTLVYDSQDAGARFYTCIWTLYDCMVAAALAGKRFVVLDRPNPAGGREAYGPVLERAYATFIGRVPIAQAHGMTVGELALLYNGEFVPSVAGRAVPLTVVEMSGWRRGDFFDATGLPWVPPSPNMATPDTALVYAGTGMFEGTTMSEGRGTVRPFEMLGAEGLDGRWARAANAAGLPGVHFREAYYSPTFGPSQGRTVGGLQLHVHDRHAFDPVRTGIALLVTAKRTWRGFAWRPDRFIDKLTGSPRVRTMIDAGAGTDEVTGAWQRELTAFRAVRRRYLRYR
ncbi:exo-beta-N-acetylmuramidase NamZ family protein [Streptomyces triculaminicus]|uniref:exo-beta-N-acetylmuramidase NamZ family protein n=1 Tax=Streptomyces triculaminicus TaxID=2816232 RepID=UPI0037D8EAC3